MSAISQLTGGYYPGLQSVYLANPTKGAISVSRPTVTCALLTGWFAIDHITFSGNTVSALDLRFEQHCSGYVGALHGAVHWAQ